MAVKKPLPNKEPKKRNALDRLLRFVIVTPFQFGRWALMAIGISILIEWIGMFFWWDIQHSDRVLQKEISYLSDFNQNMLTNMYPADLAALFAGYTQAFITFLHIDSIAWRLSEEKTGVMWVIGQGFQSMINVFFIFSVRLAMSLTSISGFLIVGLLALMDGLTEREIRKECGGLESAMIYHYAKRWVGPSMIAAFGLYLTLPVSIHPTAIFLPAMFITGLAIYVSTSTFKKYL